MKKLLVILLSLFIIFSCGILNTPSWTNIGSDGIYVENCRDTVAFEKLDSICRSNDIKPTLEEWSVMKYYNTTEDYMSQWTYIKGLDTLYTITALSDMKNLYIFTIRTKTQPIENK